MMVHAQVVVDPDEIRVGLGNQPIFVSNVLAEPSRVWAQRRSRFLSIVPDLRLVGQWWQDLRPGYKAVKRIVAVVPELGKQAEFVDGCAMLL